MNETNGLVHIIPGAGEKAEDYQVLMAMLKDKGFEPNPISIDWSKGSFVYWVDQAKKQISQAERSYAGFDSRLGSTTLGFSYGGVVSLFLDRTIGDGFIFCSTPNVFVQEDQRKLDAVTSRHAGFRTNWKDLESLKMPESWSATNLFLYGSRESEFYAKSAETLATRMREKELSVDNIRGGWVRHAPRLTVEVAPEAGHNVNSLEYIDKLREFFLVE